ncbi:MAG: M1 family aminopeptidase [Bacteroidales bacterium]|nr:M1 family aminopeptidase [Bacteroidales bacterium]
MKSYLSFTFCFLLLINPVFAQFTDGYPRDTRIDALHYDFTLHLEDTTDRIEGVALILLTVRPGCDTLGLDLINPNPSGKGMQVSDILLDGNVVTWSHQADRLRIPLPLEPWKLDTISLEINYSGIPSDGLIISTNRHGDRTFFADNWPNRAHHWIPCIDHPSDKATVSFTVKAPEHYRVVSNGLLTSEYPLTDARYRISRWVEAVPVPTKVMVIGVADFAWETAGYSKEIPVQSWVYAKDRINGFLDYAPAVGILTYFQELIGPYSYEKLANVQSRTRFGGMENSGCIFYHENSVSGQNRLHSLLAHEIAHQWFGDAVTEGDWHHVWLSEGFATYLEACYADSCIPGRSLALSMRENRNRVVSFFKRTGKPVIDTTVQNFMNLLNANSYQKGAWVLHMLREEVGEEAFWDGLRQYYTQFRNKTALTHDFRQVMEAVSGLDLKTFFHQWLQVGGHPVIELTWSYQIDRKELEVQVNQKQEQLFDFPLEFGLVTDQGVEIIGPYRIGSDHQTIVIPVDFEPREILLDPGVKLLFESN